MKIAIIFALVCSVSGCGYLSRLYTHYTGSLTYKCSKAGVEYVQADSGLALSVNAAGQPVTCKE